MNRQEYLKELGKYLKDLPKKDYDDTMNHFEEYFEEVGIEHEEALIEELGSPEILSKEILKKLEFDSKVDFNSEIKGSKNLTENDEKISTQDIENISIDLDILDIEILESKDEYIHILKLKDKVKFNKNGNCLNISELKNLNQDFEKSGFGKKFYTIFRFIEKNKNTLVLEIPSKIIKKIQLQSKKGDVSIRDVKFDFVDIKNIDGDCNIDECYFKHIVANFDNGDFDINDSTIESLICRSNSGDVNFDDTKIESTEINLENGDVNFSNLIGDKFLLKNLNGDINIEDTEINSLLDVEIKHGDANISDSNFENLNLVNFCGDNNIEDTSITENLRVINKNGDIEILESEIKLAYVENSNGDINLDEIRKFEDLKVKSRNGDIDVNIVFEDNVKYNLDVINKYGSTDIGESFYINKNSKYDIKNIFVDNQNGDINLYSTND